MIEGDNINNINEILTIVNNKLKQHIDKYPDHYLANPARVDSAYQYASVQIP